MAKIETTWKLLFDGPQGFRLIVEYHSNMRPEDHEAVHRMLMEKARQLLALEPKFFGRPVRLIPVENTDTGTIVHKPIPIHDVEPVSNVEPEKSLGD